MVEERGDGGDTQGCRRIGERDRGGPARHLIVQPTAGEQRTVVAEHGRRGAVEQAEVPRRDLATHRLGVAGDPILELTEDGVTDPPHRGEVLLLVEHHPALVDLSIEVNRELGHAGDGVVHGDESGGAVAHDQAAGDAEVAIEPRVEQRPAVDLYRELLPAEPARVGVGLDAQAWGVRVRADDPNWRRRVRAIAAVPRHQRRAAAHEALRGSVGPGHLERELGETGGGEDEGRRCRRVPRGR